MGQSLRRPSLRRRQRRYRLHAAGTEQGTRFGPLAELFPAVYGDAWLADILAALVKCTDRAGKELWTWQRKKLAPNAASCSVVAHTSGASGMACAGGWVGRRKQDIAGGEDGVEECPAYAESFKNKLELILEGEPPQDFFASWKPQEEWPIDWNPNLNDGARLNIHQFPTVPDVCSRRTAYCATNPRLTEAGTAVRQ